MITVNFRCKVCHQYDDRCRGHKIPWCPGWWMAAGHKKFEVLTPVAQSDERWSSNPGDVGSSPARGASRDGGEGKVCNVSSLGASLTKKRNHPTQGVV